jgi:hypothetical protein
MSHCPIPDVVSLTNPWCFNDQSLMFHRPIPDVSMTNPWCFTDHSLMFQWPIPDVSLTIPWCSNDQSLTFQWPIPDVSLTIPWCLPSSCQYVLYIPQRSVSHSMCCNTHGDGISLGFASVKLFVLVVLCHRGLKENRTVSGCSKRQTQPYRQLWDTISQYLANGYQQFRCVPGEQSWPRCGLWFYVAAWQTALWAGT